MSSSRRRIVQQAAVACLLLGGVGIIARTLIRQSRGPIAENLQDAERKAVFVRKVETVAGAIEGNGVVEPLMPEIGLTADVPGRIGTIFVKEGDAVLKGTTLAEIENAVQRSQVAHAEAEISVAAAELDRVMHGMRTQDVNAIASEAIAAKARAALAASDLARTQELVSTGSVAPAELEMSKRRSEAETAAARAAAERAQGASSGARREDVLIAQAHLKAATASLEEARGALARTQIVAPCDGKVLRLKLHVGEYHNPATDPLIILADVQRIRVRMDVDERDIAHLKPGLPAWVTASAFGAQKFPAKVVDIGGRMGRRRVRLDDPKDRMDVKVLETVLELEGRPPLVVGMRVSAFVKTE